MKNYHKTPYRGIFGKAAKILGFSGDNAARIASNKYRRGNEAFFYIASPYWDCESY